MAQGAIGRAKGSARRKIKRRREGVLDRRRGHWVLRGKQKVAVRQGQRRGASQGWVVPVAGEGAAEKQEIVVEQG